CLVSEVVTYLSFIVIIAVIAARFFIALYFYYFVGWRLGNHSRAAEDMKRRRAEFGRVGEARPADLATGFRARFFGRTKRNSSPQRAPSEVNLSMRKVTIGPSSVSVNDPREIAKRRERERDQKEPSRRWSANFGFLDMEPGPSSLRATLNSVAHSYYPSTHKVLFVVADGIVKGKENDKSTPDILIDMIEVDQRFRNEDPRWGNEPPAYSYVAIADGVNRKNYARVYAGWYKYQFNEAESVGKEKRWRRGKDTQNGHPGRTPTTSTNTDDDSPAYIRTLRQRKEGRVPMLLIVKCGNDEEQGSAKPGNRGKRDSQIILMNFLSKVIFDDRMTELEFDIFFKLFTITGVNPEKYECVLMIDADTRIYPDSITHMVSCLLKDDRIMGLCGETRVSNKWDSWVTMIQVFEYYISHHMSKAFESVFGTVTCLPGCFSMYRIKTPKGQNGYWVPILANPDIVEIYSENVVDTLHKKNLLLLGEDRFLTTMMIKSFPKRKMVFCPPAVCKTVVPDTFKVLLSQRRRWINSTIHNLMELVLVRDMCGAFCISMQFVIFMDLVGTLVLPAAITFTITLIFLTIFNVSNTLLPLILLAVILGLPAVLIVITVNRLSYVFWLLIYLLSLPIWNFVLPIYAFWHFDDFSWGETRRVTGEVKGHDHSAKEGEFDGKGINMKRWSEWVQVRKMEHHAMEESQRSGYDSSSDTNGRRSSRFSTSVYAPSPSLVGQQPRSGSPFITGTSSTIGSSASVRTSTFTSASTVSPAPPTNARGAVAPPAGLAHGHHPYPGTASAPRPSGASVPGYPPVFSAPPSQQLAAHPVHFSPSLSPAPQSFPRPGVPAPPPASFTPPASFMRPRPGMPAPPPA
ncbi:Chitin synthase, class 3, partial [Cladochytrium tenue]